MFASESLAQALRQVEAYGRDGLPVLSGDGTQVRGWITSASVLHAVARELGGAQPHAGNPDAAADAARPDPESSFPQPPTPLPGYQVIEVAIEEGSPASGKALGTIIWPTGWFPVSVLRNRRLREADPGITLAPGDRINLLARAPQHPAPRRPRDKRPDGHAQDGPPASQPPHS